MEKCFQPELNMYIHMKNRALDRYIYKEPSDVTKKSKKGRLKLISTSTGYSTVGINDHGTENGRAHV